MKRHFDRTQRVNDLIQKSLAQILLQDMSDSRFRFVTITGVAITRDFAHAKIYVSMLIDEENEIKDTIQALNRAAKSLRYELAQTIELRVMPELKFVYDESTAQGFKISKLIDDATRK